MLSPSEFAENYAKIGESKAKAAGAKLFLLAILAGLLIGLGAAVTNTAAHTIENVSAARIICGLLFPFGLVMVVLIGAELFTGNCLMTISVLSGRIGGGGMLYNLAIVYLGNFVGAVLLAATCANCGQLGYSGGKLAVFTIKLAAAKCSMPFGNAVMMGILCNILVCAGVMCALEAKEVSGRVLGAFIPVSFFVICGFEHCIANMYYVPAGLFALRVPRYARLASEAGLCVSGLTWRGFLFHNLLPVTIGNLIGGCGFAASIWSAYGKKKTS